MNRNVEKRLLLADIRNNYQKYHREIAYEYIDEGILTKEDLIDRHHLLILNIRWNNQKHG